MLNIGGWLSWQAVRALVPWASPWMAYGLAALSVTAMLVLYGYHLGSEGKSAALVARDMEWTAKINEANETHAKTLAAARQAADAVAPTPVDRTARLRECKQSPTCRDRGR